MRKFIVSFSLILVFSTLVNAQNETSQKELKRPKVGLVMSGGGAKGFAYIGLFKVLEEVNMPVDYVGGSSMGAITAALYSLGYSSEAIEQIVREQNWNTFISDKQDRKYISYEEKLFDEKYLYTMPIENNMTCSKTRDCPLNLNIC